MSEWPWWLLTSSSSSGGTVWAASTTPKACELRELRGDSFHQQVSVRRHREGLKLL